MLTLHSNAVFCELSEGNHLIPLEFSLEQNYPNPFNPETTIRYQLSRGSEVKLSIYNLLGQRVRVLVNKVQATGAYEVKWDGRNDNGRALSSGVYVYRIQSGEFVATRKLVLIR